MTKVALVTLGCDKNRVDAERSLGSLLSAGFAIVDPPEPAFALVINTCGFIDAAKEESVAAIMEGVRAKEAGYYDVVAVTGCLVARYPEELRAEIPEVDLWLGLDHPEALAPALAGLAEKAGEAPGPPPIRPAPLCFADPFPRALTTPGHYSFLKIGDGCDSACRFCAIPRIRGKLRSAPLDVLVAEARALEALGVKELNLVAQDTTAWGRDLPGRPELADLVEAILAAVDIPWLRILYAHPEHVGERLIGLLASEPRLLGYLDLPVQHVSDSVLAAMGRRTTKSYIVGLLDRLAARVPGLALRTTFLVGYPGETDGDFDELLDFVAEGRFAWASGFVFSPQDGTLAERLPGRVPAEVAEERIAALFDAQRDVTRAMLGEYIGREAAVLVDGPWDEDGGEGDAETPGKEWLARTSFMAAEVDGVVHLSDPAGAVRPGGFVKARVTDAFEYELAAETPASE